MTRASDVSSHAQELGSWRIERNLDHTIDSQVEKLQSLQTALGILIENTVERPMSPMRPISLSIIPAFRMQLALRNHLADSPVAKQTKLQFSDWLNDTVEDYSRPIETPITGVTVCTVMKNGKRTSMGNVYLDLDAPHDKTGVTHTTSSLAAHTGYTNLRVQNSPHMRIVSSPVKTLEYARLFTLEFLEHLGLTSLKFSGAEPREVFKS